MLRRLVALAAVAIFVFNAPAAAQAFNPVGAYSYTLAGDEPATGTFEITGRAGNYAGAIRAEGSQPADFSSVQVNGNRLTLTLDAGNDVTLVIEVTVQGNRLSGQWTLAGETGDVTGRKTS
jgi:hypothetical protein